MVWFPILHSLKCSMLRKYDGIFAVEWEFMKELLLSEHCVTGVRLNEVPVGVFVAEFKKWYTANSIKRLPSALCCLSIACQMFDNHLPSCTKHLTSSGQLNVKQLTNAYHLIESCLVMLVK